MDDLTTENTFHLQATWFIDVIVLYFDMLPIGLCTAVHWHTSGRLVQELNVCTVDDRDLKVQVKYVSSISLITCYSYLYFVWKAK